MSQRLKVGWWFPGIEEEMERKGWWMVNRVLIDWKKSGTLCILTSNILVFIYVQWLTDRKHPLYLSQAKSSLRRKRRSWSKRSSSLPRRQMSWEIAWSTWPRDPWTRGIHCSKTCGVSLGSAMPPSSYAFKGVGSRKLYHETIPGPHFMPLNTS